MQTTLFGKKYEINKFPRTQYLGSKERLIKWILELVPENINTVFDAFSGSSVVSYYFKDSGYKIYSNDFLKCNSLIAKALVENQETTLDKQDIEIILDESTKADNLIESIFTDVFFERDQAQFLDKFRANVEKLDNEYKRALALVLMNRSLTRKVTLGHFAHLSAIKYSKDPERIKRNPSLAKHLKDIFQALVNSYNYAVFNNQKENKVFCEDTICLISQLKDVDLVYFDPPYCGCHPDYQAFYHFLETYVQYWKDKEFVNGTKMYYPKTQRFCAKTQIEDSFEKLFENSGHIPYWLISYNSKSYPEKSRMIELIEKHKKVEVYDYKYANHYGGKGSRKVQANIYFIVITKNMNFTIYQKLKRIYDSNDFEKLLKDSDSLLFLKIRSIARKSLLIGFADQIGIDSNQNIDVLIEDIANHPETKDKIDNFIKSKFEVERNNRREYQDKLISELYQLRVFDWGGFYQNNLERTIVNNYIKKIKSFNTLLEKIDNEINESVKGYILCSWFNHWTSLLIEDIFKDHKRVLPAIGLIKKVDFFIDQTPFDLKVTYFPEGFMSVKRKEKGLKPELTELKKIAKENNINFDTSKNNKFCFLNFLTRLSESHLTQVKNAINDFHTTRWKIIDEAMKDKKELKKWLYEEQGERRFDSANRLFLVLIDKNNLEESWKLKRNIDFLKESISSYLDKFKINDDLKVVFNWKDKKYTSVSDVLFIVRQ